jgi:hypothetical protein
MGQEVDFKLVDLREGRSDTDYRVLNFPLATYKILLRQGAGRAVAPERVATLPPGGCVLLGQTVCAGLPNSALCVIIPCNLTTPDCCSHTPK